jgi:DNA mismatch repair protein MutS2
VDAAVLAEAEAAVPSAERDLEALLAAAEERQHELTARLAVLGDREAEARELGERLMAREGEVIRRESELRTRERAAEREAREAARQALLQARTRVEEAVRLAGTAGAAAARDARRLMEEGIQEEGEAVAALADAPLPGSGGPVAVGSRVRTSAGAVGSVVSIRGDGRLVVAAGAMRLVVPADQVQSLPPASRSEKAPDVAPRVPDRQAPAAPMEIDLRGLRVDEAESTTVAALDAATLSEHPHLRIIHGMGTGAVRDRVQQVLRSDRRVVHFAFAPQSQGGTGVTIVEFAAG